MFNIKNKNKKPFTTYEKITIALMAISTSVTIILVLIFLLKG